MEKKFTVTHKQKQVDCRMVVFNRLDNAPKSEQIKGQPIKKIDVWTINCWVEGKEIHDLNRTFYQEQTLLEMIPEVETQLRHEAQAYIEDSLKQTVSERLSELGFK